MYSFFPRLKMKYAAAALVLAAAAAVYLYCLFLPGIWHGDAFLYLDKNSGSFSGSDKYAHYSMKITPHKNETDIEFSVNGEKRVYGITKGETTVITQNGEQVFSGKAYPMDDYAVLVDDDGKLSNEITVTAGNDPPSTEELFPTLGTLYSWADGIAADTRGNPWLALLILLVSALLALDIIFPDLFFLLRHRLEVDGGEPSAWYREMQIFGRYACAVIIVVLLICSFTTH